MPWFTRALARTGARIVGVSDRPIDEVPEIARQHIDHYLQVTFLGEQEKSVREILSWPGIEKIRQVECLWEPCVLMAAAVREKLDLPGMTIAETIPYRFKDEMKRRVSQAGVRVPRYVRTSSREQCLDAAAAIGFPLIIKPLSGAGSVDTHRVDNMAELEQGLDKMRHVSEIAVEEFIEGEEFTFDAISIDGRIVFESVAWYRPRPLVDRVHEWVSPQTIVLRDLDAPHLVAGRQMGRDVLKALQFRTGFTHMEWYLKPDGEVVFGEIGARPAGAHIVDLMNYACDIDLYEGWAETVTSGRFSQRPERRYNSAIIVKRAQGQGRIQRVAGLEALLSEFGTHVMNVNLLPVGTPRNDWRTSLVSDGYVILRHPDLETLVRWADRVGTDLQLYAE
jgi:biotin carboxylase